MLMPLLALFLFVFLPWQVALPLYVPIALGSLALTRRMQQTQRETPASGREAMIGAQAVVTNVGHREAKVRYRGEIWRAVSAQPLRAGQQVVVEAVEGLILRVTPLEIQR
jgi:membrane-bound serine protease (ClpP class)